MRVGPRSCPAWAGPVLEDEVSSPNPRWLLWEERASHATKMYQAHVGKAAAFHYPQAP